METTFPGDLVQKHQELFMEGYSALHLRSAVYYHYISYHAVHKFLRSQDIIIGYQK